MLRRQWDYLLKHFSSPKHLDYDLQQNLLGLYWAHLYGDYLKIYFSYGCLAFDFGSDAPTAATTNLPNLQVMLLMLPQKRLVIIRIQNLLKPRWFLNRGSRNWRSPWLPWWTFSKKLVMMILIWFGVIYFYPWYSGPNYRAHNCSTKLAWNTVVWRKRDLPPQSIHRRLCCTSATSTRKMTVCFMLRWLRITSNWHLTCASRVICMASPEAVVNPSGTSNLLSLSTWYWSMNLVEMTDLDAPESNS